MAEKGTVQMRLSLVLGPLDEVLISSYRPPETFYASTINFRQRRDLNVTAEKIGLIYVWMERLCEYTQKIFSQYSIFYKQLNFRIINTTVKLSPGRN